MGGNITKITQMDFRGGVAAHLKIFQGNGNPVLLDNSC